jgi:hypothetical protein
VKDPICFIKSNRKDVLMSFSYVLLRKCFDSRLAYRNDRLSNGERYNVFNIEDIPICKMVRGLESSPFQLMDHIIDYLKQFQTNIFEGCNTVQKIYFDNLTMKNYISKFPLGTYENSFKFFDETDDNIYSLSLNMSVMVKRKL